MATVNKDFKIKSGLIVEGTTGTINGQNILTEASTQFIIDTVGGSATAANTPNTVVLRDENGDFAAGTITANLDGTAAYVDSLSGHTTTEISEGTNLYFTNERAINAGDGVFDAYGTASTAETNAKNYADSLASNYDAAGSATTAENNAKSYADTVSGNAYSDATMYTDSAISGLNLSGTYDELGAADQALSNANGYTDSAISTEVTNRNSAIATAKSEAISTAERYTDTAVANLVDSAPELLNTLNEIAAAIADNPNYATDVANLVATKADTTYVDGEISSLDTVAQGYATTAETNAKSYADSLASNYDAAGAATTAKNDAKSYADSLASNYDAAGAATTAENNAKGYADSLATNYDAAGSASTAESNAKNYADGLAVNYDAAGSASNAEVNANDYTDAAISNLNLAGTYDALGAAATAESNANSYTDNYVGSVLAGNEAFVSVDVNSVARQIAATVSAPTAGIITAYSWAKADYRSAKLIVKVAQGTHTELSEVLVTLDTNDNVAMTEFALVGTNGELATVSSEVSGNDVNVVVTTVNNSSTITVVGTLIV